MIVNATDPVQSIFTMAERDAEIIKRLANGETVKQIAATLYISTAAITSRLNMMRIKEDANNVTQLVAIVKQKEIDQLKKLLAMHIYERVNQK